MKTLFERYIMEQGIEQTYTSADSSINKYKFPSTFTSKPFLSKLKEVLNNSEDDIIITDVGGGKYDNVKEFFEMGLLPDNLNDKIRDKYTNAYGDISIGIDDRIKFYILDPYNRTPEYNEITRNEAIGSSDIVTCNNVLNVIKEQEARYYVLETIQDFLAPSGTGFIQIYPGNNSGEGNVTKNDVWQNNLSPKMYEDEIRQFFNNVKRHGSLFVVS